MVVARALVDEQEQPPAILALNEGEPFSRGMGPEERRQVRRHGYRPLRDRVAIEGTVLPCPDQLSSSDAKCQGETM